MVEPKSLSLAGISYSDGLAIGAIILTMVLLVLDKAGKLKGPILFWLLAFAALMTMPLVFRNTWVLRSPNGTARAFRTACLLCAAASVYSGLAAWIATGEESGLQGEPPPTMGQSPPGPVHGSSNVAKRDRRSFPAFNREF
jgi:hypothetical protein